MSRSVRRLARVLGMVTATMCGAAALVGSSVTIASASLTAIDSGPPADCAAVLAHAQTTGNTKTFSQAVSSNGTTTYFFDIATTRTGGTYSNVEDCAYANGDPSNVKYGTEANNPTLNNGHTTVTLTVTSGDSICDRVELTGTAGSTGFNDYTNLVGSSNGAADASACAPGNGLPEAPATGLLAVAGLGVAGAAAYLWRRRAQPSVVSGD